MTHATVLSLSLSRSRSRSRFIQIEKKTMHMVRLGVIVRENEFVTVVIYENLYSNLLTEVTI